jgi:hypothetical protein
VITRESLGGARTVSRLRGRSHRHRDQLPTDLEGVKTARG